MSREIQFNAAHRLFNANWDDKKNREVFGKCSNPNYHGHNYRLIVTVCGEIDKDTGYVIDLKKLKKIIDKQIVKSFDHKNLNLEVEEFSDLNPTAENIAVVIWNRLIPFFRNFQFLKVTLYETPNNFVEFKG